MGAGYTIATIGFLSIAASIWWFFSRIDLDDEIEGQIANLFARMSFDQILTVRAMLIGGLIALMAGINLVLSPATGGAS